MPSIWRDVGAAGLALALILAAECAPAAAPDEHAPAAAAGANATATLPLESGAAMANGVRSLTLREALDLATERNLQLALSVEQVEDARNVLLEAQAALGPSITLSASQSNATTNLVAQGFPAPGQGPAIFPTLDGPFNSFDARLHFTQTLFNPVRSHLARVEDHQLAVAQHQQQAMLDKILTATALAYIEAQQQVATVAAVEADLRLSQQLFELAQDQHHAGVATGVDVARAETRVAQDRFALTQAKGARAQSLLRLKRVLGLPARDAVQLTSPLEFVESPIPDADKAVAHALATRQEIQLLDERVDAAEEGVRAAESEGLPVIGIEAAIGPSGVTPSQTVYLTRSIGIGVSVPLLTSGLLDAHRDRAKSRLRIAELTREDARRQIEEDVHLALLGLDTSAGQVHAARTTLTLAERLLELARDRFQAGVADDLEVLDALTSATTARSRLIEALAGHNAARANLQAALGEARSFGL